MYTVRKGLRFLSFLRHSDAFGHSLVGQKHEFFDEFICIFRPFEVTADGLPFLIHVEVKLFRVELDAPFLEASGPEKFRKPVECDHLFGIFALVTGFPGLRGRFARSVDDTVVFKQLLCLFIGITAVRLDDGMHDAVSLHVGLLVQVEDAAESELFLVRTERTDEVAQPLWKHRNGAVDKIDRRCPLLCLTIDDVAFFHVMRHVGNVYAHFPQSVFQFPDRERIIEVLCILRIYRTGPHVPEVFTLLEVLFRDFSTDFLGGLFHPFRILVRQSVLGKDGVHFHIIVTGFAQHIHHFAHKVLMVGVRPLGNLHQGTVVCLPAFQFLLWNQDVMNEEVLLCYEEGNVLLDPQPSYEGVFLPLQNLDDHCLLYMVLAASHELHLYMIAVQGSHGIALRDEDRRTTVVWEKCILAVRLADEGSFLHLSFGVQRVSSFAYL